MFQLLIDRCEILLRQGDSHAVANLLQSVKPAKIPRGERLRIAQICRRTGLITLGLKILNPVIRAETLLEKEESPQSSREKAQYAFLLDAAGMVQESLRILNTVNENFAPEALLYRAFCHFSRWEYAQSIPLIERYLQQPIDEYSGYVGRVNLASALLNALDNEAAFQLLNKNIAMLESRNYLRLAGNCLEMRAQIHIRAGKFANARQDLELAAKLLGGDRGSDMFFVRKWKTVISALEDHEPSGLLAFQTEAHRLGQWESVREADLFLLKLKMNPERFKHLYAGTPFPAYRARIVQELQETPGPDNYTLGSGDMSFDLATGQLDQQAVFKAGSKPHLLLDCLLLDFYRPTSVGAIYTRVFPDEYFNIYSSPNRVHQVVHRTREILKNGPVDLSIVHDSGYYTIKAGQGLSFRLKRDRETLTSTSVICARLRRIYGENSTFTSFEARETLRMSEISFKRFSSIAIREGVLEKVRASTATRYRVA